MTLRDLAALHRRHVELRDYHEELVGILAAAVVNFGFRAPKREAKPADFGLGFDKRRKPAKDVPSAEDQIAMCRAWYAPWVRPAKTEAQEPANEDRRQDDRPGRDDPEA